MPGDDIPLSTGVDSLVKLVRERGRIELREAAIELGISQGVIEEWARVLEREGVLKIDYQLTRMFLTTPLSEKSEAEKKAKDIADMQVTMSREIESEMRRVERVGRELDEMRDEFVGISKVFEEKMAAVRQKTRELDVVERQYEEMSFRSRNANEKLMSQAEALEEEIENSEKKLESMQKIGEDMKKEMKKVHLTATKSDKK